MTILDKITTTALGLLGKSPQKYNQVSKLQSLPFELESDENGEFTYTVGDHVIKFSNVPSF